MMLGERSMPSHNTEDASLLLNGDPAMDWMTWYNGLAKPS